MYEMTIDHLRVNRLSSQRTVVLKGKEVSKYLSILIGESEGNAIALKLQGQDMQRPMTHDLMDSMIRDLGATVTRVVVSEMSGDTFLANVELRTNDTTHRSRLQAERRNRARRPLRGAGVCRRGRARTGRD